MVAGNAGFLHVQEMATMTICHDALPIQSKKQWKFSIYDALLAVFIRHRRRIDIGDLSGYMLRDIGEQDTASMCPNSWSVYDRFIVRP